MGLFHCFQNPPRGCNQEGEVKNTGLRSQKCRTPREAGSCLSLCLCTQSCELHVCTSRLPSDLWHCSHRGPQCPVSTKKQWWWGWIPGVTVTSEEKKLMRCLRVKTFDPYFLGPMSYLENIFILFTAYLQKQLQVLCKTKLSMWSFNFSLFIIFIKLCLDFDLWWLNLMVFKVNLQPD